MVPVRLYYLFWTREVTNHAYWRLGDIGLSQKLQEELKFEQQPGSEAAETPEFLKTFTEQGVWSVRMLHVVWLFPPLIHSLLD